MGLTPETKKVHDEHFLMKTNQPFLLFLSGYFKESAASCETPHSLTESFPWVFLLFESLAVMLSISGHH